MPTELKEHYTSVHAKVRNVVAITQTVKVTLMKVPEGVGWIALGNLIYVRNVN